MTLVEIVLVGAVCIVLTVPAISLLVSSRRGISSAWSELVARNLAMEALEWGATLPTDGLSGPLVLEETPVGTIRQARLADGATMVAPSYIYDTYSYPADYSRFFRRLEVSDASPAPQVPMLKLTATVVWLEPGTGRIRNVQLWRTIGP